MTSSVGGGNIYRLETSYIHWTYVRVHGILALGIVNNQGGLWYDVCALWYVVCSFRLRRFNAARCVVHELLPFSYCLWSCLGRSPDSQNFPWTAVEPGLLLTRRKEYIQPIWLVMRGRVVPTLMFRTLGLRLDTDESQPRSQAKDSGKKGL